MPAAPSLTIALLVTTYRRNAKLVRLVAYLKQLVDAHRGPHRYFVCVSDSDPANNVELPAGISLRVNDGQGFDDNLLGALRFLVGAADFVLAIADDDLPCLTVNPLAVIDAALACDARDVVLFNHVPYTGVLTMKLGERFFTVPETVNLSGDALLNLAGRMPRYAGILYRTGFIEELLPQLRRFRGSLHLYAAPLFIAADRGRMLFFDHALVMFHDEAKHDGAWENARRVHDGLLQFLRQMQPCLSARGYQTVLTGLHHIFFRVKRTDLWGNALPEMPDFPTLEGFTRYLHGLPAPAPEPAAA